MSENRKYSPQVKYLTNPDKIKKITITLTRAEQGDVIDFWESLPNKRQWFIEKARESMKKKTDH